MAKKKLSAHLDLQQNELQNAVLQNANSAPTTPKEGQIWYDTTTHKPMYNDGTNNKEVGKEYTFSTGLTDTNGTITVTDYSKLLKNTSTYGNNNIALAIGYQADAGYFVDGHTVPLSTDQYSLAIGYQAKASGANTIQIGYGSNTTANTLKIGNYSLLNTSTGLIPDDRISTNIARTSAIPTVNNATLTIQKNSTTIDTFTANASSDKTINITVPTAVTDLSDASNYALVANIPTTVAELTDASDYAKKDDVAKIFNPAGTLASQSDLPTLSSSVLGNVYRVTADFNTTSDFVEGSGKTIKAGNDVVVVNIGSDASPTYKFNVWGDFIDISGKQDASTAVTHTASTAVGSATKGVYIASNGTATAMTYSLNKDVPSDAVFTDTDTKNTAGGDDTSSKIFLVGMTSQTSSNGTARTYTHDTAFVDANGRLNSAAPASSANDTTVATTKWVKDQSYLTSISSGDVTTALGYTPCKKLTASNTALTASGGEVTWEITNSIGSKYVAIHVYEASTGEEIECYKKATDSKVTIKMNSSSNVAADTYFAVIIG